jgi:hypothetical protein
MKNLLIIAALAALAALAWFGYGKYKAISTQPVIDFTASAAESPAQAAPAVVSSQFSCDGRTHCSQMRSRAEATYFIQHCPGTRWTATMTACHANSSGASDGRGA